MELGKLFLILVFLGIWIYTTSIEPAWLDAVHLPLVLPRLDDAFDGFRLVQISDIHMGGWMNKKRLARVVDAILAERPDAVAITGDFSCERAPIKKRPRFMIELSTELRRLSAETLTFAVLGNHDHWEGGHLVRRVLKNGGVIELSNRIYSFKREDVQFHICGVDDIWVGRANLGMVIEKIPEEGAAILLAHEPDFADISAATERFDLQISGHSHGGQIKFSNKRLPLETHLAKKYPAGLYQVGSMKQYTNRGVGMGGFKVRFNCRPEITIFELRAEEA